MKLIGLLIFLSVEIIFSIGFGFSAEVNFLIEMNEFNNFNADSQKTIKKI
jgi:hypothetical protein